MKSLWGNQQKKKKKLKKTRENIYTTWKERKSGKEKYENLLIRGTIYRVFGKFWVLSWTSSDPKRSLARSVEDSHIFVNYLFIQKFSFGNKKNKFTYLRNINIKKRRLRKTIIWNPRLIRKGSENLIILFFLIRKYVTKFNYAILKCIKLLYLVVIVDKACFRLFFYEIKALEDNEVTVL